MTDVKCIQIHMEKSKLQPKTLQQVFCLFVERANCVSHQDSRATNYTKCWPIF